MSSCIHVCPCCIATCLVGNCEVKVSGWKPINLTWGVSSYADIRIPSRHNHSHGSAGLLRQLANNDGNKAAIAAAGGMELLNRAAAAHPSNPAVLEQACSLPGHRVGAS